MIIGIPKEILGEERRVAATPESVEKLIARGFQVIVQSTAGEGVFVSDQEYAKAGARIVEGAGAVFAQADLIMKVKQPCFNTELDKHEAELLKEGGVLVTFLHPATPSNHEMVRILRDRNVTSFTMDGIPRVTRAQAMDALTSMSTVSGYKAVIMAANRMPRFVPMMGTAIGMLPSAKFLVVGAGVVGLQSIATAKRLGGIVQCVDIRKEAAEAGKSLGAKPVSFAVPDELAVGEGGYARALPDDWIEREREMLAPLVRESDVVILSALVPGEVAPLLVTADMVHSMKPGSIIVDVSVDQGGNCALTQPGEEVWAGSVLINGIQNIPGSVPVHATHLYSNNVINFINNLFKDEPGKIDFDDEIVRATLVTRDGRIVHEGTLKAIKAS